MANDQPKNIAARVRALILSSVTEAGYTLWDVLFYKEGGADTLSILIDREGGIGIEDCEAVTRIVDPILDRADPIAGAYTLEVSSAGTERALRTDEHFRAFLGHTVRVRLYAPLEGKKEYEGTLSEYTADTLTVGQLTLNKESCAAVFAVDDMTNGKG